MHSETTNAHWRKTLSLKLNLETQELTHDHHTLRPTESTANSE